MRWMVNTMAWMLAAACAHAQPSAGYAAQARAIMRDYVRDDVFSGVVLVARDGKPIFRQGFGAANREWSLPNTPRTTFRIGSVTKQFTAAAILQLVDEHRLALDDTLGSYVHDLPPGWQAVTIRQLLQHASGIPRYTALDDFDDTLSRVAHTPRQIVDLVKDTAPDFAPGTGFEYDNTGYVLLGCVVEAVSGMRYRDYLEQKLLRPLHLAHSGYDDGRAILPDAAQDYVDRGDTVIKSAPFDMSNAYAAGAMSATIDDLLAWQRMLVGGEVLSPESTRAMFTDGGHHYGFGWFVDARWGHPVYEHGGSLKGFNAMIAYYPRDRLTVIVLGNHGDEDAVEQIAQALARAALGMAPVHREVKADGRQAARFAGRYQLTPDMVLTVEREGDRLLARATGQRRLALYPEGDGRYFFKAVDAQLVFDEAGFVTLHQGGRAIKAPRID